MPPSELSTPTRPDAVNLSVDQHLDYEHEVRDVLPSALVGLWRAAS